MNQNHFCNQRFRILTALSVSCIMAILTGCQTARSRVEVEPIPDELVNTFENAMDEAKIPSGDFSAWLDYNNDLLPDLSASGNLYRNNGDGTFTHIEAFKGGGRGGVWADFDNDGLVDCYSNIDEGKLIRNLGDDKFEDVPIPANVHQKSRVAAWGDANNDGHIDLMVVNYENWPADAFPDLMYINNGDGTFADPVNYPEKWSWRGRGVNWSDFDDDGDQDFYISNYRLQPNQLWVNDGTGKFTDESKARGVLGTDDEGNIGKSKDTPQYKASGHTIGSCFGDVNGDGHIDLVVVNFAHAAKYQDRTMVCISSGPPDYTFTNINDGAKAGIFYQESYGKGALGDYDNDGDLDLYLTTVYSHNNGTLFENDGTGHFTDVGKKTDTHAVNGYGLAWVDYDCDGDLDLHGGGKLLRNRGNNNAWVKVKVVGNGKSNASAIGARVTVTAGKKSYVREVYGGNSGNQNDPFVHFGLGTYEDRITIKVRFSSGKVVTKTTYPRYLIEIKEK